MSRLFALVAAAAVLLPPLAPDVAAQAPAVRVAVVKNPFHGNRNVPERSQGPDWVEAGLLERLAALGATVRGVEEVGLTPEEDAQYGAWNRLGLANGHLAETVARNARDGWVTVALLGNCNSVLGVLGGLEEAEGGRRRVGLVFIDAHGDFNTPETTLSGMLGGMPVAVSAGHALDRLRRTSKLEDPLPMERILWAGVRDLDPLEAERFREHGAVNLTVADLRGPSERLRREMDRLAQASDVIYVHVDMDVLDPAEVPGHDLNVPDGPSSAALARAIEVMFAHPEVAALGIASTPSGSDDPDGVSRRAAHALVEGALRGLARR